MNGYFKNTGWKYEILRFIKKKRLLCFMMIISIFIVMKYSSLPFILGLDSISFIRAVFQTPDTNTGKEVLRIAENLSLAYCTSLLFYIMVDYVPMRQTELKTRKLMDSHLNELNQHMT